MSRQSTVKLAVFIILKTAKLFVFQIRVLVPKRQLPIQADLIINRLRLEASIELQHPAVDDNGLKAQLLNDW